MAFQTFYLDTIIKFEYFADACEIMQHSESLRIRSPLPDVHTSESHTDPSDNESTKPIQRIPTYILIISMTNFTIFVYTGNETNLYFSIITFILWMLSLIDAVYDKNIPHLESEV